MQTAAKIIAFLGRAGDRSDRNIAGTSHLANIISDAWNLPLDIVGNSVPAQDDQWHEALESARPELERLAHTIALERDKNRLPICVIPTDGAAAPVLSAAIADDPDVSVIWFDAHADFNTPDTTTSGYLGGMALAGACGLWNTGFPKAASVEQVILIGARAIDADEQALLEAHRVTKIGAGRKTLTDLSNAPLRRKAYIHLDLDCLEPGIVPLQYNEPEGLPADVVRECIDNISSRCEIVGFSISEFFQTDDDAARDSGANAVLDIISSLRPAHRANG